MATTFAEDLVFDVEAGDACLDVLLDGFGDHEGSYNRGYSLVIVMRRGCLGGKRPTAVSSIHIGNQGWAVGVETCNHLGIGLHVMKLRETQVGHAQS